jgi:MoaA/NifB/PqqE/SkfB family radical SAM enzyme
VKHQFSPDKIFAHPERVSGWLRTGLSRPITFELDITNRCNNKCPACFGFYPGLNDSQIPLAGIRRVLRQIKAAGGKAVTFTGGGEPTVHPDLPEAIACARSLGLDVALITNGLKLDEALARTVLANCTWTRLSLDAASPAVYKATHGLGPQAWEKVKANTALLARLKAETNSRCTVGIGFLTSPETARDILPFAALGRALGADYAQYRPLLRRHGEAEPDYSPARVVKAIAMAEKRYSTPAYRVLSSVHKYALISRGELGRGYGACYGHNFAAVICADLKMYICCHMRGLKKYSLGDLKKSTVSAIWASRGRAAACASIDFRDCPPLCRCDSFNRILWELKENRVPPAKWPKGRGWTHENFI